MFQVRLYTLCIRCIKSDKLRQTNFNEFLDDFLIFLIFLSLGFVTDTKSMSTNTHSLHNAD